MLRTFVVIAFLSAPAALAGCPGVWDGPNRCFANLGRYPIEHLNAAGGVTVEELTNLLGEPVSKVVRREKDTDYPVDSMDYETITLRFAHQVVVISHRVEEPRFWLDRYEVDNFAISLKGCRIQSGQSRPRVLRALGFTGRAGEEMIWHHMWCEGNSQHEEWATVTPDFDTEGRLRRMTWVYWAD